MQELEAQLNVMEEKIKLLQEEGGVAAAGTSTSSGLCYSPSCSGAGDDVCYSPSCPHPSSTVGINTAADVVATTSNVFDSSSTDSVITGMIDSNYSTTVDNTNITTGGFGLTTDTTACYTTESSASLSDIHVNTAFTGQSMDPTDSMHGYILTGCYSSTCFSGACYSPTCPNFKLYLEIINTSGSIKDVIQSSLVQHAPHGDSTILHDVSVCYSPSCGNAGSASDPEQSATICYSPSCLSRGSSEEEGQHVPGDRVDEGDDDENKKNLGKKINDNKSKQLSKASDMGSGICYSPSCFSEGSSCYSPSCFVRMGSLETIQQDSGKLLVDWSDGDTSGTMQSLNPFATGQDNIMQDACNGGQIDWNMLGSISSLHDSIGGTLESSFRVVGTQELNPFGDTTSFVNTNPFAHDINPFISNTGAGKCFM